MKYKFKIGDKVVKEKRVIVFNREPFSEYYGEELIVTSRTKSQLGNEYELYCPRDDNGFAWVYEEELEFWDKEKTYKNFKKEIEKENIEKNKKYKEEFDRNYERCTNDRQKEILMRIYYPFYQLFPKQTDIFDSGTHNQAVKFPKK